MKNLTDIETIVRGYLGIDDADVDQPIIDSVHYLSNIFFKEAIDTSQSTAVGETTLDIPDDSIEIISVRINGDNITPLDKLADLDQVNYMDEQRCYEYNDKIQFTEVFSAIESATIFYKKGFIEPTATVGEVAGTDTDVPLKLMELVYLGAQIRYYNYLLTTIATGRVDLPDIQPDELRKIKKELQETYDSMIKMIKINA